jgi:hypothetical protein
MRSAQSDRFVAQRLPPPGQWPELLYALPELRRLQAKAQLNLVQVLFDQAEQQGGSERPFLRSPNLTLSYAQAQDRVNSIAQVLTQDLDQQRRHCRLLLRVCQNRPPGGHARHHRFHCGCQHAGA